MTDDFDPIALGEAITSHAEAAARLFALVTAAHAGMFDAVDVIVDEVMGESEEAARTLIYGLLGSFSGMIQLMSIITGNDPNEFISTLATGNSQMMEVGREILRAAEQD